MTGNLLMQTRVRELKYLPPLISLANFGRWTNMRAYLILSECYDINRLVEVDDLPVVLREKAI